MSNVTLYLLGFIVFIGGLAWGGYQLGVPQIWLGIGAVILLGIAIMTAVSNTRRRESPPDEPIEK